MIIMLALLREERMEDFAGSSCDEMLSSGMQAARAASLIIRELGIRFPAFSGRLGLAGSVGRGPILFGCTYRSGRKNEAFLHHPCA